MKTKLDITTLIELSKLLGLSMEDCYPIRSQQDCELITRLQSESNKLLDNKSKEKDFYFGCLDYLVHEENGNINFHLLEFNGTGMGRVFNISEIAIEEILSSLTDITNYIKDETPLMLVPFMYNKAGNLLKSPLIYEKIMYAQSIKDAFIKTYGSGQIVAFDSNTNTADELNVLKPTVLLCNLSDVLDRIYVDNNRFMIDNYPVCGMLRDPLIGVLMNKYYKQIDPSLFYPMNGIYQLATNKSVVYKTYNEFIKTAKFSYMDSEMEYETAISKGELIDKIFKKVHSGGQVVIKPFGVGLGRGIEFFLGMKT